MKRTEAADTQAVLLVKAEVSEDHRILVTVDDVNGAIRSDLCCICCPDGTVMCGPPCPPMCDDDPEFEAVAELRMKIEVEIREGRIVQMRTMDATCDPEQMSAF